MSSNEHMILSDAIRTAIESEKTVIKQRKIICILICVLVASFGKFVWTER